MTDVACFCGYLFSFDGDAGACPSCGEVADPTDGTPAQAADAVQARPPRLVLIGAAPCMTRHDQPRSLSGTGI
jgi:hypothetical protein